MSSLLGNVPTEVWNGFADNYHKDPYPTNMQVASYFWDAAVRSATESAQAKIECGHPKACLRQHERFVHSNACEIPHCNICDGGLFVCIHCNKAEIELSGPCICTICVELAKVKAEAQEEIAALREMVGALLTFIPEQGSNREGKACCNACGGLFDTYSRELTHNSVCRIGRAHALLTSKEHPDAK